MSHIANKVRFYISGDVVRDIGIVYLSEILKRIGIKYELTKNYLEFDNVDSRVISDYILDNLIFNLFLSNRIDKIGEKLGEINCNNFIEKIEKSDLQSKEKIEIKKGFEGRRFPYIRNSGRYGGNTTLNNMEINFRNLVDIVLKSNISVREKSLDEYVENDIVCSICNINKTTKLGIDLKERTDSKYIFLFRGPEISGFKNNGNSESNICFECEFLNLITLLYIAIERPVMFGYTNDLNELLYINYKLMLKRRLYNDKGFYMKLIHEKIQSLQLFDFRIDTNKGIVLKFNSVINYKELLRSIELIDIIDNYNFSREQGSMKSLGKVMVNNKALINLQDLLLSNIVVFKDSGTGRDVDLISSSYNLLYYLKVLWIVEGKGEDLMMKYKKADNIYSEIGKRLSVVMDSSKKKNFVFKVVQLLKSKNRSSLFQTIMHTLASYGIGIKSGFVEGIMETDELQFNTNVGLFIQEIMKDGGNYNE